MSRTIPAFLLAELMAETRRSTSATWTFADESISEQPRSPFIAGVSSDGTKIASYFDKHGNADMAGIYEIAHTRCLITLQTPEPVKLPRIFTLGWVIAQQNQPNTWRHCKGPMNGQPCLKRVPPGAGEYCADCYTIAAGPRGAWRATQAVYDISTTGTQTIPTQYFATRVTVAPNVTLTLSNSSTG